MRVFIELLLFMSVFLTVIPTHARDEKIETFKGRRWKGRSGGSLTLRNIILLIFIYLFVTSYL